MNILERVRELANLKGVSLAEVERRTGLSSGSITKWDKSSPIVEKLDKVADYFGVTIGSLLGKPEVLEDNLIINSRDLNKMLDEMKSFDGKPMTPQDREVIRAFLLGKFSDK